MATKYTILETAHTEESDPFSSKGKAVEAADAAAEQYPGTPFRVATGKGTVVHTAFAESVDVVDEDPADDVPETQVDADEEATDEGQSFAEVLSETMGVTVVDAADEDDVDADFEPEDEEDIPGTGDDDFEPELDEGDTRAMEALAAKVFPAPAPDAAEEDPGHGLEVVSAETVVQALAAGAPAPAEPATPVAPVTPVAAPAGATLELCAANTNAKRMHYRPIGGTATACGSAKTSRRANAHQIETASLCTACEKVAGGQTVDTRPAGTGRATGSRKSPKRLVVDAGEIRDLVAHLKQGIPYTVELADGARIEIVGGDPASGELDEPEKDNLSDIRSINIVAS